MIYMDASALVTLTVGREYAGDLRVYLAERPNIPLGTSPVGIIETVRNVDKIGGFPHVLNDLNNSCAEIELTSSVRDTAARLAGRPRTIDAIHVASALSLGEYLTVLISYDKRMLEVAAEQGLPVASPGAVL